MGWYYFPKGKDPLPSPPLAQAWMASWISGSRGVPPHSTLASSWHPPGQAPGAPQRPSDRVLGQALPVPWARSRLILGSASPWHSLWNFVYRPWTSVSRATFAGGGDGTGSSQSLGNLSSLLPMALLPSSDLSPT